MLNSPFCQLTLIFGSFSFKKESLRHFDLMLTSVRVQPIQNLPLFHLRLRSHLKSIGFCSHLHSKSLIDDFLEIYLIDRFVTGYVRIHLNWSLLWRWLIYSLWLLLMQISHILKISELKALVNRTVCWWDLLGLRHPSVGF